MKGRDPIHEGASEGVRKKKWKWRGPGEEWGEEIDPCRGCEV